MFFITNSPSATTQNQNGRTPITISTDKIRDFDNNQPAIKELITVALNLAGQKLSYKYGSNDPANGGMDCSGTINYLLKQVGIQNPPRQADLLYSYVQSNGHFHSVTNNDLNSVEFQYLKPGDLLFWSGTYNAHRELNVTHVMLYLGKDMDNNPLMVGASDGRTYKGRQIYGVSIFDLQLPKPSSASRFLGYGCIPDIGC